MPMPAGGGDIEFADGEGTVQKPGIADAHGIGGQQIRDMEIGAAAGQPPGFFEKIGVVEVVVVVDIVVERADRLVGDMVGPGIVVGDQSLAFQFFPQEFLEIGSHFEIGGGQEQVPVADGRRGTGCFRDGDLALGRPLWRHGQILPSLDQGLPVRIALAQPAVPGLPPIRVVFGNIVEIPQIAFVDQGQPGQGRFFRIGFAGIGIFVRQQGAGKLLPVGAGGRHDRHHHLEFIHAEIARLVYPQFFPGNRPGNKKIGGQIDTAADAGGGQVVELIQPLRIKVGGPAAAVEQIPFIMMQAQGIVSQPDESVGQPVGLVMRQILGAETEIDPAEPPSFIGTVGKGKMAIRSHHDPAMAARRRLLENRRRKIQGGTGHDLRRILEGDPLRPGRHCHRLVELQAARRIAGDRDWQGAHGSCRKATAPTLNGLHAQAEKRTPAAVILNEHLHSFRKTEFHVAAIHKSDLEAGGGTAENVLVPEFLRKFILADLSLAFGFPLAPDQPGRRPGAAHIETVRREILFGLEGINSRYRSRGFFAELDGSPDDGAAGCLDPELAQCLFARAGGIGHGTCLFPTVLEQGRPQFRQDAAIGIPNG